jgi:TonB family protein
LRRTTYDFIIFSISVHLVALALVMLPIGGNTSSSEKIEIEVNTRPAPKKPKMDQKPLFPATPSKPSTEGRGEQATKETEILDLSEYGDQVKVIVDPVWVKNITPHLGRPFHIEVFILPDVHGNIKQIKILKSSGNPKIDSIALQTFREVGQIPAPPPHLTKEGIIWDFSG